MGDFDMALTEVLPAFGVSQEEFERCLPTGILQCSPDVADVLEQGKLVTDLIRNSDKTGLVSVLLEGKENVSVHFTLVCVCVIECVRLNVYCVCL